MRGVNKLVLEVRPEDGYFEKALLFIRPESINETQKQLSENAEKLLSDIYDRDINRKSFRSDHLFLLLTGIAAGFGSSWLIMLAIGMIS